ncbi:MAG TPA: NB-ARC domain-containing protein [Aggregatilineaceae bacterium]|nr:NB-ARC domain-containing protein [Aggregatilineaceae bacterium]
MADLKLLLFGEPHLTYQGKSVTIERRKALALLAYLAVVDQPQSRDVLCGLLWPGSDLEHARASLRSALSALVAAAPPTWLDKAHDTLAVNHEAIWIDIDAFLEYLSGSRVHNHAPTKVCAECEPLLVQAVDLYPADFLGSFSLAQCAEFEDWRMMQRQWLRGELSHVLGRLSAYYSDQGDFDTALERARQWLALDQLHEPATRQIMRLCAITGQRAEALRQYEQCVELLDSELATLPEDETTQLYQAIQANRAPRGRSDSASNGPVTGILPPLPTLIVGRETAFRELKGRLGIPSKAELRPVTIVQGWPGVGKSTTVAALAHDPDITQSFSDGVLWASFGERPAILAELTAWAEALRLGERDRTRNLDELTAQLTAVLRERRMLLILDDVWDAAHAAPFRVGGKACALVLTTRLNSVAQQLAPTASDVYRIPVLEEAPALDLLGQLSPETVRQYPQEALQLIRDLEGLPLAIQVAGRLLHSEARLGWGIANLLTERRAGASLLSAHVPSDMTGAGRDTSPTVAALLQRSTDALDAETRRRFATLGLFVPKPATFGLQAMALAWDVPDARPTCRVLVNRGLLEPISGGRFQMHALLVLHARSLLKDL